MFMNSQGLREARLLMGLYEFLSLASSSSFLCGLMVYQAACQIVHGNHSRTKSLKQFLSLLFLFFTRHEGLSLSLLCSGLRVGGRPVSLSLACLLACLLRVKVQASWTHAPRRPPLSTVEESERIGVPWAGPQPSGRHERKSPVAAIPQP